MKTSGPARLAIHVLMFVACTALMMCRQAPPPVAGRDSTPADSTAYDIEAVADGGVVAGVATLDVPPALLKQTRTTRAHESDHPIPPDTRRASGLGGLLPDAVVYFADIRRGRGFDGPPATALLNQRAMQFEPRVQLVQPGTTLEILNSDPTSHNVRGTLDETRETLFNYAMPLQDQRLHVPLERPGRVNVICDMTHGWMKATLIVMRHPYYAVTDAQGRFELAGVPPGDYVLRAWHDTFGEKTLHVRVLPAAVTHVTFSFSLS